MGRPPLYAVIDNSRKCCVCLVVKSVDDFSPKRRRGRAEVNASCKECVARKARERRHQHKQNGMCAVHKDRPVVPGRSVCAECKKLEYGYKAKHQYGITQEQFNQLAEQQRWVCAICRRGLDENSKRKRLCVDHCHKTGKIRGLLCHKCNGAIGLLQDSPDVLRAAIIYLERHQNQAPTET